jgi:beta-galactosidase/beta-glucuronidase
MLKLVFTHCCIFLSFVLFAQPAQLTKIDLNGELGFQKIGRGTCALKAGELFTKGAYAVIGDTTWENYSFEFDVKAPESASKVYLWAGFRTHNRDDRYVLALKGGFQNDLYLSRLGYMGADDFLALRHLDFQLKKGVFYHVRVMVAGNRIRVFLNNEKEPRIDVLDKDGPHAPNGGIALGGGWIPAIFKNVQVQQLKADAFKHEPVAEYHPEAKNKEAARARQRATYHAVVVKSAGIKAAKGAGASLQTNNRTEISLNGKWLFAPGYMIKNEKEATTPTENDKNWHIMPVPSFWNPDRIWLFGERYGTASKGVSDSYYQKEIDRSDAYTFDYKKTNTGWYRQWVELPRSIEGKHLELSFDAVSKTCEIFINGIKAGSHIGMFGDIKIDATPYLHPGKNLIAVKVLKKYIEDKDIENPDKIINIAASVEVTQKMLKDLPHGFFDDDPAGIWQPVSLIITNPLHIQSAYIKPDSTGAQFEVTVQNSGTEARKFSLATTIASASGKGAIFNGTNLKNIQLDGGASKTYRFKINGLHPKLWSPEHPNLYNFDFALINESGGNIDEKTVRSGFKSFVIKNGLFYLNGHPYWLRGGNQTAMPLAPNDTALAEKFSQLMHEGHMAVTRTHTTPYTETWMDASDKYGIGVSFEGTWPWLMLGDTPIPSQTLLDLWKKELLDLVKKYRNHPSLLIWTMNNEMKFYLNDPDKERAKKKMRIISDVVKAIRQVDPEHPIVFDSNYDEKQTEKRMGKDFMDSIDDGDIDDIHQYTNWYDESIFDEFKGRFEKRYKTAGRPLISQEMSTGYPDETGHPTRFYTFVHQNPSSLVGKYAYAYQNPKWFMQVQSFISKELGEALRRSNPQASGILQFSLATWFSQVADANHITPNRTYYAMQKALQPVLVSAELWGRHFYAGHKLPTKICIVNDQTNGQNLNNVTLVWTLTDEQGKAFATGKQQIQDVPYYGRVWTSPDISIPAALSKPRIDGKLVLTLLTGNKVISKNDYDLVFATRKWIEAGKSNTNNVRLLDKTGKVGPVLNTLHQDYTPVKSVHSLVTSTAGVAILAAADSATLSLEDVQRLQNYAAAGGRLLVLHSTGIARRLFPEAIRGVVESNKEIANLEIAESPVFKDISPLDIRYFNNQKEALPTVLDNSFQINRQGRLQQLASSVRIHGYLSGQTPERMATLDKIKGFPIIAWQGQNDTAVSSPARVLLTTLNLEKASTDPIAGKLFTNMIHYLQGQ